ncbi:MAG TPA: hypothetical protein VL382_07350 [Terriglobales bacterium]|nr:hypothetical protein [Terriglobales bacterium]
MFIRATFAAALLSLACLAQQPATSAGPTDAAVTDSTYVNNFFHFEYRIPAGFTDHTADLPEDPHGVTRVLLHLSEPRTRKRGTDSVTLVADDARYYWHEKWTAKTGADYLRMVTASIQDRSKPVGAIEEVVIGGRKFYRQEYDPIYSAYVHQTMLATVLDGYILTVTFSCDDRLRRQELLSAFQAADFRPARAGVEAAAFRADGGSH